MRQYTEQMAQAMKVLQWTQEQEQIVYLKKQ